jgi:hypothetical protein
MTRQPLTTICILSCECKRIFVGPVRIGQQRYCNLHKSPSTIVTTVVEYRAKCRKCKYSKPFGAARITALTKASAHGRRTGHEVDVYQGEELIETVCQLRQRPKPRVSTPPLTRQGPSPVRENPRSQNSGMAGQGSLFDAPAATTGPVRAHKKDQLGSYSPKFLSP